MKRKKLIALLLLCLLLAGCARSAGPDGGADAASFGGQTAPEPPAGYTAPEPAPEPEPEPEPDPLSLESGPVRLLLTYDASLGSTQEGRDRVAAALSALVLRETGIETEITWTTEKEAPALLAANRESFDLYAGGARAASLESQGLFRAVPAAWLETYAPDFLSLMGSFLRPLRETLEKNGRLVEVEHTFTLFPLYKPVSEALYMDFRADLCEAAGYSKEDVAALTDWNQVYFLMKAAQAAAGEDFVGMVPTEKHSVWGSGFVGPNVICGSTRFAETCVYDNLGDTLNLICGLPNQTLFCLWENSFENDTEMLPWYYARFHVIDRMNMWYREGLIWPDSFTDAYPGPTEEIFAHVYRASELAPEAPDRYRVKITNTMVTAAQAVNGYFAIPAGAKNPASALLVLNVIYAGETAGEWANLLVYGVRDADYTVGEDGRVSTAGETAYRNAPLCCNSLFLTETDTEEPGTRLLQTQALAAMGRSAYYGLTVTVTDSAELRRALRDVAGQYIPILTWGKVGIAWRGDAPSVSSTTTHEMREFHDALKAAGIDEYLGIFRSRISDWLYE